VFDFRDETGSEDRFKAQTDAHAPLPVIEHRAWWLVHNLIAHPLIGILPVRFAFKFHDWTSRQMSGLK
jgi:hypothetical protein